MYFISLNKHNVVKYTSKFVIILGYDIFMGIAFIRTNMAKIKRKL